MIGRSRSTTAAPGPWRTRKALRGEARSVPLPPILSLTSAGGEPEPEPRFFSLSERLILVIRQFVIAPASSLSAWHPELAVWIHGDDGSNVAPEDPASPT